MREKAGLSLVRASKNPQPLVSADTYALRSLFLQPPVARIFEVSSTMRPCIDLPDAKEGRSASRRSTPSAPSRRWLTAALRWNGLALRAVALLAQGARPTPRPDRREKAAALRAARRHGAAAARSRAARSGPPDGHPGRGTTSPRAVCPD